MTKSLLVVVVGFLTISASASAIVRADELFSGVSMESAFKPTNPATEKASIPGDNESPERGRRVLSLGELAEVLSAAGLDPQTNNDKFVSTKFEHSRWKFPVAMSLSGDYESIHIAVLLSQLDGQKPPSADRLLALLGANRKLQGPFFSYIEERKQIELFSTIPNGQVGPRMIREVLERLTTIAEETAPLWEIGGNSPANLVGKWSAARSASEAFALQLNSDGSFALVSVKDGKQGRSAGKFSLSGGQLVLATGEGGKLAGNLSMQSADAFEFAPQGSTSPLKFARAK